MVSRLQLSTVFLIIMSMMLVSCQDTMPARSTIAPDSAITTPGTTTGGTTGSTPVTRPDGAVNFKLDFCGCKDNKAVTYGNCQSFCSSKNTNGAGVLYANFTVSAAISLNSGLGNLYAWCNTPLPDEQANPVCVVKAKDEDGNERTLDVTGIPGSNSLTVNIDTLSEDKAYVLTLVEQSSGAKSDSIQIIKFSEDIATTILGPLKNAPISQYSCLYRPPSQDENTGDIYYDAAFRFHLYFHPRTPPNPIPAGEPYVCHDFLNPLYGMIDDILYPRLELIPGIYNLWDTTDPRFYDNNGNGNEDVNDIIIQKTKNFGYTLSPSTKFFVQFPEPTSLSNQNGTGSGSGNGGTQPTAQAMGWYTIPWIDQSTYRSYCLNSTHYNSSNPIYKAMRDVIGVDQEGLYVATKVPETVLDRDNQPMPAPDDVIFLRETDLKKVWFYMKNGVPTVPTDAIVASVPVYLYYPLNPASPFVKSSTQKIYQVKGANELQGNTVQQGGTNTAGLTTSYPPHDRKIGCIPKF